MPSSSCSAMPASCWEENQPWPGADIALWVAGSTTRSSGTSQSSACPLQPAIAGAASLVPPLAANAVHAPAMASAAMPATATRRPIPRRAGAASRCTGR
jgi:hypothetical protein